MIINITDLAKAALDDMFKNYDDETLSNKKFIRIYLKEIAWHGPVFNVAQDEPTSDDNVYVVDDEYHVIINKDLSTKFSVVNIFYKSTRSYGDFYISTDLEWKDEYHYCQWSKPW
mgnify:CR=1 FL=1